MTATESQTPLALHPVVRLDLARAGSSRGERRSRDALRALSRRHDALCTEAVDSWEIAAGLEAQGMSDSDCHAYGYPDVFALADALFAVVPRRGATLTSESSRPAVRPRRSLMRGAIYALPAVVGIGAVGGRGVPALTVLIVALAAGWSWSQALSFLGHRNLGWVGEPAARSVMRTGLVCGLVVIPLLVAAATYLTSAPLGSAASGSAIGIYMVAAAVLLVLGDDRALLLALAPGTVIGVLSLAGLGQWLAAVRLPLAALSVLAVLILAVRGTSLRSVAGAVRTPAWGIPERSDLLAAVPHLLYGTAAAAAVGLGPSTLAMLRDQASSTSSWHVTLPVVLSMGAAELQLERLMHRIHLDVRTVASPELFGRLSTRALGQATGGYLAAVVLASVLALLLSPGNMRETGQLVMVSGYAALAACFFMALILVAIGRVAVAGSGLAAALAGYLVLSAHPPLSSPAVYAASFGSMFTILLVVAAFRLRNPVIHL